MSSPHDVALIPSEPNCIISPKYDYCCFLCFIEHSNLYNEQKYSDWSILLLHYIQLLLLAVPQLIGGVLNYFLCQDDRATSTCAQAGLDSSLQPLLPMVGYMETYSGCRILNQSVFEKPNK